MNLCASKSQCHNCPVIWFRILRFFLKPSKPNKNVTIHLCFQLLKKKFHSFKETFPTAKSCNAVNRSVHWTTHSCGCMAPTWTLWFAYPLNVISRLEETHLEETSCQNHLPKFMGFFPWVSIFCVTVFLPTNKISFCTQAHEYLPQRILAPSLIILAKGSSISTKIPKSCVTFHRKNMFCSQKDGFFLPQSEFQRSSSPMVHIGWSNWSKGWWPHWEEMIIRNVPFRPPSTFSQGKNEECFPVFGLFWMFQWPLTFISWEVRSRWVGFLCFMGPIHNDQFVPGMLLELPADIC